MVTRADGFPQGDDLPGFRDFTQISRLNVLYMVSQRPAAEQPHRPSREDGSMAAQELRGVLSPVSVVDGTSNHEGMVTVYNLHVSHRQHVRLLSAGSQRGRD